MNVLMLTSLLLSCTLRNSKLENGLSKNVKRLSLNQIVECTGVWSGFIDKKSINYRYERAYMAYIRSKNGTFSELEGAEVRREVNSLIGQPSIHFENLMCSCLNDSLANELKFAQNYIVYLGIQSSISNLGLSSINDTLRQVDTGVTGVF